jgi:transposase
MRALSKDIRERILEAYDGKEGTQEEVARRFKVSMSTVKKLLRQRRETGEIGNRYHRCGRKPMILGSYERQMQSLIEEKPDLTLKQIREELGLECTLVAIHYVLKKIGITYKKRHYTRANKSEVM